jgi:signal recognition particle subunit SRP54
VEALKDFFEEIENSLLDADVPFDVVEIFLASIKEDVAGKKYPKELNAKQALVKIMNQRLIELLGGETAELSLKKTPVKILLVGLQGTGKTTACAKLASFLKKKKKSVLLASTDVYRPAAREQLKNLAQKVGVDFYEDSSDKPEEIARGALRKAKFYDVFLLDTAGRLQIDSSLMQELKVIADLIKPEEILYVQDAMAGQESLNVAKSFSDEVPLTGAITTKMDSDTRAGAILGLKSSLGISVKFLSSGEDPLASHTFSPFHPERVAQRILGMGDMLTLIENIEQNLDKEKAQKWKDQLSCSTELTFEQMKEQFEQVNTMLQGGGGLSSMMKMIPGMSQLANQIDHSALDDGVKSHLALINSMTGKERRHPALMQQGSRKNRVIKGAGLDIQALNRLIKHREKMSKMMKKFAGKNPADMLSAMKGQMPGGILERK